ncbi:hypothetical protein M011DRAFT_463101, partial [Sporormia fimetaria CBS 119925]
VFIPISPSYALKNRHWFVFWSSTATLITTFGIVPLQAAIFSTKVVTRVFPQDFTFSPRGSAPLDASFAQSVYGILKLNETLPAFMTENFTVAPFTALGVDWRHFGSWHVLWKQPGSWQNVLERENMYFSNSRNVSRQFLIESTLFSSLFTAVFSAPLTVDEVSNSTWQVNTTLYGVDLQCEDARVELRNLDTVLASEFSFSGFDGSTGCRFGKRPPFGNDTVGTVLHVDSGGGGRNDGDRVIKPFSAIYSGHGHGRSLEAQTSCEGGSVVEEETFFVALVRNKVEANAPMRNATALYCRPLYFEQAVFATVDGVTRAPLATVSLQPKLSLLPDKGGFGSDFKETRALLPSRAIPAYMDERSGTDLSLVGQIDSEHGTEDLHVIAQMALMSSKRSLDDNLDPKVVAETYERSYRLLFARAMAGVLSQDNTTATGQISGGTREIRTEAVVLEPVFTYLVEVFLGFVSASPLGLLWLTIARKRASRGGLVSDPGSIAATMSLVADNEALLSSFADIDGSSTKHFEEHIQEIRNELSNERCSIVERKLMSKAKAPPAPEQTEITKPTRPAKFRLLVGLPLAALFVALAILGAVLFVKSKTNGLALPSRKPLVQNIVRAYIPTALAMIIDVRVRRINLLRGITIMNSMALRGGLSQPLEATLRSGKTIYRSRGYDHVIDQSMAKAEDQYRALSPLQR